MPMARPACAGRCTGPLRPDAMTSTATPAAMPAGACDCHCHVFDPAYPLAATASAPAPVRATLADYRHVQAELGLSRAVLVQSSAYGFDNRCMLAALAELGDQRARGRDPAADRGRRNAGAAACGRRAGRSLHDVESPAAVLGCAAADGRAHRAAGLAHQSADGRRRISTPDAAAGRAAGPAGDRPQRQVPVPARHRCAAVSGAVRA